MGITAGELNTPISFLRAAPARDAFSKVRSAPVLLGNRWSKRSDVSDGERVSAAAQGVKLTARFGVRHDSLTETVTNADLIECDGVQYEITGRKEWQGRRVGIEFSAAIVQT